MSRNATVTELMQQINGIAKRGERLARASGGLVDPMWFSAVQASMSMAAGDLDAKGLLVPTTAAEEKIP